MGMPAKPDSGALRGGANDYVQEKEGSEDFDQETRPEAIFAGAKIAVTVGSKPAGLPSGLARGDRIKDCRRHDCPEHLSDQVWNHISRLKAVGGPEPNRHRAVEMSAGDVANRISHGQHGQPEGEADPEESDAQRRETRGEHGTATAGKCQPESAEEFGPKTSRHIHDSSRLVIEEVAF
jgi:hypothetical protein